MTSTTSALRVATFTGGVLASAFAFPLSPALSADDIETMIVTARKVSESVQKIPIAVTAISAETIERANIRTANDFIRVTPGLQVGVSPIDNSNISFNIRGINPGSGYFESPIGVYIDGVYRELQFGLTGAIFDLERVEVLKGPQGTLYGKNTSAGVVNIITKKPDLNTLGGFVTGTAGAYVGDGADGLAESVKGAINVPIVPGKLALRLAAAYDHSDGYGHDGVGRELNNRNNPFVRGHIFFESNENWQVLLSGDYGSFNSRGAAQQIGGILPTNGLVTAVGLELGISSAQAYGLLTRDLTDGNFYNSAATRAGYNKVRTGGAGLTIDGDITDAVHLKSITAYRKLVLYSTNDFDDGPSRQFQTGSENAPGKYFSEELNLSGHLFQDKLEWQTGAFYANYTDDRGSIETDANTIFTIFPPNGNTFATIGDNTYEQDSLGVFGHAVIHATDKLTFSGGVRWSKDKPSIVVSDKAVDFATQKTIVACTTDPALGGTIANECRTPKASASDSAISYNTAVNYQFNDDLMAYFTASRGYKSGDFNSSTTGILPPRHFNPEHSQNYEVGVKSEFFNRRLLLNAAGYILKFEDIQKTIVVPITLTGPGGVLTQSSGTSTDNAAQATIKGIELEMRVKPAAGWEFGGTYAYTEPKFDKFVDPTTKVDRSNEAFQVAKHTYNLDGSYTAELPSGNTLRASVNYHWQSDVVFALSTATTKSDPILRQNAYGLLGMRVTYAFVNANAEISLFATNLLDKQYYIGGQDIAAIKFLYPGEPRFIGFELTKRWGNG